MKEKHLNEQLRSIRDAALGAVIGVLIVGSLTALAGWVSPRTWTPSETVTASLLNTHIRDNELYLKGEVDAEVRVLNLNVTAVGNVGTGTDDLITYSLPAATLATDTWGVEICLGGTYTDSATAGLTIGAAFGVTTISSMNIPTAGGSGSWRIQCQIHRTAAATQVATCLGTTTDPGAGTSGTRTTSTTPGETLSGAVTIKGTGSGTNNNDIVEKYLTVKRLAN